jgi:hypothetical protein
LTLGYATRKSDNETLRMVEWVECVVLFGESGPNVSVMRECPLVSERIGSKCLKGGST